MKKRKLALLVCAAAVTTLMATACAGKSGQDGKTASGAESRTGSAVSDAQSEGRLRRTRRVKQRLRQRKVLSLPQWKKEV